MIYLCTNNNNVLQRWRGILEKDFELEQTNSLNELEIKLADNTHIVVLHESILGPDKLETLKTLIKYNEHCRFLVLADKPDEHTAFSFIHSGVFGYSNTYISPKLLTEAVKQIENGDVWMGKRLTRYLSECLLEDLNGEDTEDIAIDVESFILSLTEREKEVAKRIAHGCSNKCIANKLDISERTVKAHLSSIFQKTGIKDRVHLALILNSHKYD